MLNAFRFSGKAEEEVDILRQRIGDDQPCSQVPTGENGGGGECCGDVFSSPGATDLAWARGQQGYRLETRYRPPDPCQPIKLFVFFCFRFPLVSY